MVVAYFPFSKEKTLDNWEEVFKQCILDSGVENGAVVYLGSMILGENSGALGTLIDKVREILGDKIGRELGYNIMPSYRSLKVMKASEDTTEIFDKVIKWRTAFAKAYYNRLVDVHEVYLLNQPNPFKGLTKEDGIIKFHEMFMSDIGHVFKRLHAPERPGKPVEVDAFADFADPALRPLVAAQEPAQDQAQMEVDEPTVGTGSKALDEELIKVMRESSSSMASSAQILQSTASFIHQHGGSQVTNIGNVTNIDKAIGSLAQTHTQSVTINSPPQPNQNPSGQVPIEGVGGRLTAAEHALALQGNRLTRSSSNQNGFMGQ